ncbi:MAG: aromatic ring-opening dioxygenase subunit LigA [Acidimicrobiales bacterium]
MSLYYVQKYLYELNRDPSFQDRHRKDPELAVRSFGDGGRLTDEESEALVGPDIGKLYHLGVNGQILMHFAAFHQIEWADYLAQMRDGIRDYGPVREGVYALTTELSADNAPVYGNHD